MKAEHWKGNGEETVCPTPTPEWMIKDQKYCCTIEGDSWEEVMKKYHIHKGFQPYKPMEK